jgi:hypothetical protein
MQVAGWLSGGVRVLVLGIQQHSMSNIPKSVLQKRELILRSLHKVCSLFSTVTALLLVKNVLNGQ